MKKGLFFLLLAIFFSLFLLSACKSEKGQPSKTVKSYYEYLLKKRYQKAYSLILPESPPAITKEDYLRELKELEKAFELKELKVVGEQIRGDQAEVNVEITELNKNQRLLVTSQSKISLRKKGGKWYIVWPKKKSPGKRNN